MPKAKAEPAAERLWQSVAWTAAYKICEYRKQSTA